MRCLPRLRSLSLLLLSLFSAMSSGVSQLPIISSAPDQLREGIGACAVGAVASAPHPVALIERSFALQADANNKAMLARVYGSHMPMKLHMEQVTTKQANSSSTTRAGQADPPRESPLLTLALHSAIDRLRPTSGSNDNIGQTSRWDAKNRADRERQRDERAWTEHR